MRTRTRPAVARMPGRSTAPAAWPGAGVRFAARPAAERLTTWCTIRRSWTSPDDRGVSVPGQEAAAQDHEPVSRRSWARAALSHSAFTGISRHHLGGVVAELAGPWQARRESDLRRHR